jgi:hypothetical protein
MELCSSHHNIGMWFSRLITEISISYNASVIVVFCALTCYSHDILSDK